MATHAEPQYACTLAEKLHQFSEQRKYTDFAICIDDARVECHKLVICASSPFFDALCSTDAGTTEAQLNSLRNYDLNERMQLVSAVRKFFYLGTVNLGDENVEKMLQAADCIRQQPLTDKCESFLVANLNIRKGKRYHNIARRFHLQSLFQRCDRLKKERFAQVIRTPWFTEMEIDEAVDYLQDGELLMYNGEDDRLLAIHLWFKQHLHHHRLEEFFHRIFPLVRLQDCTQYQIESVAIGENGCVLLQNELNRYLYHHFRMPHEIPGTTGLADFVGPPHPAFAGTTNPTGPQPPSEARYPTTTRHPRDIPHSVFPLPQRVLVIGGRDAGNNIHSGIQVFNEDTSEWTRIATDCDYDQCDFSSITAGQNSIIVNGGHNKLTRRPSSSVRIFHVGNLQWSTLQEMPCPRERHATACAGNRFLVFGGFYLNERLEQRPCTQVDILNPTTSTWSHGQRMQFSVSHAGIAVSRLDVLIIGGDVGNNRPLTRTQMFKMEENLWTQCQNMPRAQEYPTVSPVAVDRTVFVLAGDDFLQYDIAQNQWTALEPRPNLSLWSAMTVHNRKLKVLGGLNQDGTTRTEVQSYDLNERTWSSNPPLPFPLAYHSAFVMCSSV